MITRAGAGVGAVVLLASCTSQTTDQDRLDRTRPIVTPTVTQAYTPEESNEPESLRLSLTGEHFVRYGRTALTTGALPDSEIAELVRKQSDATVTYGEEQVRQFVFGETYDNTVDRTAADLPTNPLAASEWASAVCGIAALNVEGESELLDTASEMYANANLRVQALTHPEISTEGFKNTADFCLAALNDALSAQPPGDRYIKVAVQ